LTNHRLSIVLLIGCVVVVLIILRAAVGWQQARA